MKSRIIAVEGFDAVGKTTIAKWIAHQFNYEYRKSPSGAFLKARVNFDSHDITFPARSSFYIADCITTSIYMQEHQDKYFVLDRYFYSTLAYHIQKKESFPKELIDATKSLLRPDIILYIKASYSIIQSRIKQRGDSHNDRLFLNMDEFNRIDRNYLDSFDSKYIIIENNTDINNMKIKLESLSIFS